ncbi:Lin0512 family protein [Aquibacillus saliphilus]|uniref:Lin0512 family protein n=1 Tax=Aquibacillus saliphilus TaxID=1909422 RepID=UPI001CF04DBA|nr:Lin0512 family protein [Aquibacillus saliphilus]
MEQVLFVQTGTGIDVHGQDITKASIRAVEDAISSNSLPGIEKALPEDSVDNMEVVVRLAVPLDRDQIDTEEVRKVIPYGSVKVDVTDGGMATSSGIIMQNENDENDLMYIVNAAVEIGSN